MSTPPRTPQRATRRIATPVAPSRRRQHTVASRNPGGSPVHVGMRRSSPYHSPRQTRGYSPERSRNPGGSPGVGGYTKTRKVKRN
jgi:hypothetical protein